MLVFGIDAGIASVGWAVLEIGNPSGRIVACGTRMFDAPETDKERRPLNSVRREKRGMRRVVRRRRQRMQGVRRLLANHGLLTTASADALALGLDPWLLRVAALDRVLAPAEFAVILGHIARHRGFRSNAKSDRSGNAADETSKMLSAIAATRERLSQWRTVGEMFALDAQFGDRKRNRGGGFLRSMLRDDQEAEIRTIFAAQRRFGNVQASEGLETSFADIAFSQRPLQDSHDLVGVCPFMPDEKRCARRSYSFEMFRLLSRLNAIRIGVPGADERRLTAAEIAAVTADFGLQKTLNWKFLRKRLDLAPTVRFSGITPEDEKRDFVARAGAAAEGSYAIRDVVGDAGWRSLIAHPDVLDALAAILTFRVDLGSIRAGIATLPIEPVLVDALIARCDAGAFGSFTGAGHISAAAARTILPYLARGMDYSEACAEVGFDHAARAEIRLEDVKNPVARKAVSEVLKQVNVMVHEVVPENWAGRQESVSPLKWHGAKGL